MATDVRAQAQKDLDAILKLAATPPRANQLRMDYLKGVAKPLVAALAAVGATGLTTYYFSKKDREAHQKDLLTSMKALAYKSPDFEKNPTKFLERFSELSVISPTIAKNPSLASKLLEKKLKTGFSVDDIHKLTSIESNTASTRRTGPSAAGRASAYHAMNTLTTAFGHDFLAHKKEMDATLASGLDRTRAAQESLADLGREFEKEGSMQKVSDECLGTMLAERYVLIKQAGLFTEGLKNMGKGLQYFAPALALGLGVEGVRQAIESRRNASLEAQADKNFARMLKTNDKLKGAENQHLAHEAFETLKAVAPSLAARDLVAQTFIEYTVGQGQLAPQTVQQLAEAEDKVRGIGGKSSFFNDLKSTMGIMEPKKIQEIEATGRRYSFGKRK